MRFAGVQVGPRLPCVTVFELSNAHNGDLGRALALVEAAKEAGADLFKLQAYRPDELVELRGDGPAPDPWGSEGWTMRRLYEKAQTPLKWFPKLVEKCEDVGLPWFSSVFGIGSLALLDALDCPAYKLAALDWNARKLRRAVEATGKPLIRSCNLESPPKSGALLLWCPEGYPQPVESMRLREQMRKYAGFSYHGTDPLVPALAAAFGAQMVECHVQLDDEPSELEANVSLKVSEFAAMVELIRRAEEVAA